MDGRRLLRVLVIPGLAFLAAGCASSQEWETWYNNKAHFASGDHMFFSLRNQKDSDRKVTRADVATSGAEGWWGNPVTVEQAQILER